MADRILGQPTNLTVVSDNGAGLVRVTYAPWELDWEWFDTIAIGNWLANTTSGVAVDITAKGGAENLGYWFDINQAFPSANWVTGNRITPQRQAAINQHATFAAAIAAMAVHDVLLMWYQNVANRRVWDETCQWAVSKAGSAWGMLSRCQVHVKAVTNAGAFNYVGNQAAQVNQVFLRNMTVEGSASYGATSYNPTLGFEGAGIRCSRLRLTNGGLSITRKAAGSVAQIDNCIAEISVYSPGFAVSTPTLLYNNSALFCSTGFLLGNQANVVTNCVASECSSGFALGGGGAVITFCADTDGFLPVAAGNLRNQDARTQLKFFYDLARAGDKSFPLDPRIHQDSVLAGAGLAVAGIVYDADHQVRPNPPSIGAFEPYATAYAPGAELIRAARRRQAVGA